MLYLETRNKFITNEREKKINNGLISQYPSEMTVPGQSKPAEWIWLPPPPPFPLVSFRWQYLPSQVTWIQCCHLSGGGKKPTLQLRRNWLKISSSNNRWHTASFRVKESNNLECTMSFPEMYHKFSTQLLGQHVEIDLERSTVNIVNSNLMRYILYTYTTNWRSLHSQNTWKMSIILSIMAT